MFSGYWQRVPVASVSAANLRQRVYHINALVGAYLLPSADPARDPFQDEVKARPVTGLVVLQGDLAFHRPVGQRTTVRLDPLGLPSKTIT